MPAPAWASTAASFRYYRARENGAEAAIRFMADADSIPGERSESVVPSSTATRIDRIVYRNTVSYFLRVPDGNPLGGGYADTGFQSLKRLATGENQRTSRDRRLGRLSWLERSGDDGARHPGL